MEGGQIASDIYPTRPNPLAAPAAARGQHALLVGPPRRPPFDGAPQCVNYFAAHQRG
jgi:hypothetical protein